jgi:curli biogenesis system outer membrane secretion channel CsgG
MTSIHRSPGRALGLLLLAGAVLAPPLLAAPPSGGLRYTVFVEKFENESESRRRLGDEWATQLTSALHESGRFIVVAQEDMQKSAMKEQARGASGVTTQGKKTAARGRMTPAQLLVKGVITHFAEGAAEQGGGLDLGRIRLGGGRERTEVRGTLQMIDASTGMLVAAKSFIGLAQNRRFSIQGREGGRSGDVSGGESDNVHEAMEKAIHDVIPWMVAQLPSVPWRGTVVKVEGERIIINRGSREGIAAGAELIAGESEILTDPDNGDVLDEIVHERARIRVDTVNERTSICSVVSGDARLLVEGMGVKYAS